MALLLLGLSIGFILGRILSLSKEARMERINRDQQDRGNFWFSRCQELADRILQNESEI